MIEERDSNGYLSKERNFKGVPFIWSSYGEFSGIDLNIIKKSVNKDLRGYSVEGGDSRGFDITGVVKKVGGNSTGFDITGFLKEVDGNSTGVDINGLVKLVEGDSKGFDITGFVKLVEGNSKGFDITGFVKLVEGNSKGFDITGLCKFVDEYSEGFDITGGIKYARGKSRGVSVAGLVNYSGGVDGYLVQCALLGGGVGEISPGDFGVQIGLWNKSGTRYSPFFNVYGLKNLPKIIGRRLKKNKGDDKKKSVDKKVLNQKSP